MFWNSLQKLASNALLVITYEDLTYFAGLLFLVVLALLGYFLFSWWQNRYQASLCPYTNHPLRPCSDLFWITKGKVLKFLYDKLNYDNQIIDLDSALMCRETGMIFPDAINWYGSSHVGWDFIKTRYEGYFVSWGSLPEEQQLLIAEKHESLEGFQTDHSCPNPSPMQITKEYVYTEPGPLYVDPETYVLLGWQCVPETELEVLIVQKPKTKR